MKFRVSALALVVTALPSLATAQTLSAQPTAMQTLRPSLPMTSPPARDVVVVGARGSASFTSTSRVSHGADFRAGRAADYASMVSSHAKANDVPEHLVHRVIMRESKYQPNLIGRGGTIGMMQIKLATARGMGYGGTADGLLDPQTNLTWGVRYLAGAWRAANGDTDLAVRKYAAGYYVPKRRRAEAR